MLGLFLSFMQPSVVRPWLAFSRRGSVLSGCGCTSHVQPNIEFHKTDLIHVWQCYNYIMKVR